MGASVGATVHRVGNTVVSIPSFVREIRVELERAEPDITKILDNLKDIDECASQMREIADRLSQAENSPKNIYPIAAIEKAKEIVDCLKPIEAIKIDYVGATDLMIETDPAKLTEILKCIIGNAIRASMEGMKFDSTRLPRIIIRVTPTDESVNITVTDSGKGVRKNVQKDICRTLVNSNWRGHGIGLFVSARIAVALGGRLKLEETSTAGTTFCLTLPIHKSIKQKKGM
uniref:histidine kinase n=1 Tax=Candidatus Kentrum sp. DK TaxID=2126562 RepID=A0A450TGK1_9GAMM|nr:MAG: Histidine kinase-, DNA gyrase B-, and HSP90-like ATPase [Candidatus Kentron sp. DK]